jgi:catechol 2,3-dioxygenase-like lactoylglutathione lyase family enzyme
LSSSSVASTLLGDVGDNPAMTLGANTGGGEHTIGIDHVQLAMPAGREHDARRFYVDVLGLGEVPKPPGLAGRGGCWFASADGSVAVHLGVEDDFRPARKAHPAFVVTDLDAMRVRLADFGAEIVEDDSVDVGRCYTADPFGNRIELVAEEDRGFTRER